MTFVNIIVMTDIGWYGHHVLGSQLHFYSELNFFTGIRLNLASAGELFVSSMKPSKCNRLNVAASQSRELCLHFCSDFFSLVSAQL